MRARVYYVQRFAEGGQQQERRHLSKVQSNIACLHLNMVSRAKIRRAYTGDLQGGPRNLAQPDETASHQ